MNDPSPSPHNGGLAGRSATFRHKPANPDPRPAAMLATVLMSLATMYPAAAVFAVVFGFPAIVLIAAGITLAILSATMAPDRDNRVSIE